MSILLRYSLNNASEAQISAHLMCTDTDFVPPLSDRININKYVQKLITNATRFEAWSGDQLIGLIAAYCNNKDKQIAYITNVSVTKQWTGKGIASCLLRLCIEHAITLGIQQIILEVESNNVPAIKLYEKTGFVSKKVNIPSLIMSLNLNKDE